MTTYENARAELLAAWNETSTRKRPLVLPPPPGPEPELVASEFEDPEPKCMTMRRLAIEASDPNLRTLQELAGSLDRSVEASDWETGEVLVVELLARLAHGEWLPGNITIIAPGLRLGPPITIDGPAEDCSDALYLPGAPLEFRQQCAALRKAIDFARARDKTEPQERAAQRLRRRRPGWEEAERKANEPEAQAEWQGTDDKLTSSRELSRPSEVRILAPASSEQQSLWGRTG